MNQMTPAATAVRETFAPDQRQQSEFDRLLQKAFTPQDLLDNDNFEKIWRFADALSNSALSVPKELKGNIGDCLAIVTQSFIWGLNPFAVAQKAHVINGKLGYEAQLVNAVVQQSGAIRGSFHYEYRGAGGQLECRVGAVLAGQTAITWNEFYCIADVKVMNSPLWKTNPKQQLGYLQVKNWARAYTPGALLGIYTVDELADAVAAAAAPPAPTEPPPPPALPAYAAADFAKNLPAWTKLVADGKKTASDLLATLSTKATFTEQQKAQVLALKRAAAAAPTPAPAPAPAPAAADDMGEHDDFLNDMESAEERQ